MVNDAVGEIPSSVQPPAPPPCPAGRSRRRLAARVPSLLWRVSRLVRKPRAGVMGGWEAAQRKETSHHLSEHRQARRATEGQSTPLLARSSDSRPGLARKAPCEPSWSDPWPQCPPTKPVGRFRPHQRTAESPHVLPCMALLDLTSARDPRPLPDAGSAVGCGAGVGSSTAGRARQRVGAPEPGAGASAGASRGEARGGGGAAPCSAGPVTRLSEQTCIVCVQSMQLSACFCVLRIS